MVIKRTHVIWALTGLLLLTMPAAADAPRATFTAPELREMLAGRVVIEMQTEAQTWTKIPKGRV